MGREVRRVPADWQHPKDERGKFIPKFCGSEYESRVKTWDEGAAKWAEGLCSDYKGGWKPRDATQTGSWEDWDGERPDAADFMPRWTDAERTHLMMYEDTSEGTPISPAFETPEDLARWLTDNGVSSFARETSSYEAWLNIAKGAYAIGFVATRNKGITDGVTAALERGCSAQ